MDSLETELESESLWKFEGGQRPWSEWEAMEDLYDDCIRQADGAVGHMLRTLKKRGDLENTLVIVTGVTSHRFTGGELEAVPAAIRPPETETGAPDRTVEGDRETRQQTQAGDGF
jgi:arylsulfatase A